MSRSCVLHNRSSMRIRATVTNLTTAQRWGEREMTEVDQRWKDRMGRAKTFGFPPRSWTRGRQGKPSCEGRMGAEQQGCLNVRRRRTRRPLKMARFVRACERGMVGAKTPRDERTTETKYERKGALLCFSLVLMHKAYISRSFR